MLLVCFGWGCQRMISVSKAPGGNPVARADPEHFAISFRICQDCHQNYCDRCLAGRGGLLRGPRCAECGGKLADGARRPEVWSRPKAAVAELHEQGLALVEAGQYAEALAVFDQVLGQHSGHPGARHQRGLMLRELGRYGDAVAALEQAVRLDPHNARALHDQGGVYRLSNQPERAVRSYDRALRVQPRFLGALIDKAGTLIDLDQAETALACAEGAIRLDAAGQAAGRTEHLRAQAHGVLGAALIRLGRHAEALAAIEIALSDGPDVPENYYNRAHALKELGRAEEAALAYRVYEDVRDRG
ncbi:tetratricopeptide repeat protein [Crossiella cryophila]|uniref:Tetratricopeptide (TPR) repeat protein n=1 Tax=Crossiella cryophila TaxID=43355 RepID=A0A7W7FWF8_9PSEU|nr:tetratricopeptide repeat protein [Crossiella cryophila]MBB4680212.1 tetratricopeptide (TPR) repeat protein [Crossiella cryophila]